MTPLSFLWYSLIGVADAAALIVAISLMVGVAQGLARNTIRTYFVEYEQFMRRMADAGMPPMPTGLMH